MSSCLSPQPESSPFPINLWDTNARVYPPKYKIMIIHPFSLWENQTTQPVFIHCSSWLDPNPPLWAYFLLLPTLHTFLASSLDKFGLYISLISSILSFLLMQLYMSYMFLLLLHMSWPQYLPRKLLIILQRQLRMSLKTLAGKPQLSGQNWSPPCSASDHRFTSHVAFPTSYSHS